VAQSCFHVAKHPSIATSTSVPQNLPPTPTRLQTTTPSTQLPAQAHPRPRSRPQPLPQPTNTKHVQRLRTTRAWLSNTQSLTPRPTRSRAPPQPPRKSRAPFMQPCERSLKPWRQEVCLKGCARHSEWVRDDPRSAGLCRRAAFWVRVCMRESGVMCSSGPRGCWTRGTSLAFQAQVADEAGALEIRPFCSWEGFGYASNFLLRSLCLWRGRN